MKLDPEGYASINFQWKEFECKCGCGFGLQPYDVDPRLIEGLQLLRTILQVPVYINSACRCPSHNLKEGGAIGSQHLLGKAADVRVGTASPRTVARIAEVAETIPVFRDGAILQYWSKGFCHLDVRGHRVRATNP